MKTIRAGLPMYGYLPGSVFMYVRGIEVCVCVCAWCVCVWGVCACGVCVRVGWGGVVSCFHDKLLVGAYMPGSSTRSELFSPQI